MFASCSCFFVYFFWGNREVMMASLLGVAKTCICGYVVPKAGGQSFYRRNHFGFHNSLSFFFFNVCCCFLDNLSITPIHGYIYLMWTEFTEVSHWHKNNNTKTNVVVITNYCRALLIHLFTYFFTFVINEYTFGNALYVNGHYMLHNRKMVENHC